ncbi:MAG: hypothetical protein WCX65_14200 [bacterium]
MKNAAFAKCVFAGALVALIISFAPLVFAQDTGNEIAVKKRNAKKVFAPEDAVERTYDDTLRIYLDSPQTTYKPGNAPQIIVYLKNESNKTRFFKRVWSPSGADGSTFRIFMDGVESWGSGIFKREAVIPESPDPKNALRLDPGQRAPILQITFTRLVEGEHSITAEYDANYTITEKQQRNWWNGLARSNAVSLKVKRALPRKEVGAALESVINAINKDLLALKPQYNDISGYVAGSLTRPKGAFYGAPVIDYRRPRPSKFKINVYFNATDFEPNSLATLNDGYPFLDVALIAHIDVGANSQLRADIINIVRKRGRALNVVTRKLEKSLTVEVVPFETNIEAQFNRAPNVILGTVISAEVEKEKQYDYQLKKWILTVRVNEVYRGKVEGKTIKVKCGTLNVVFNTEKVKGNQFIMMLLDKQAWQNEYNVVGAQTPRDNLIKWLKDKYSGK